MIAIAPPLWVSPAYPDRDAVWAMVTSHSPYPLMASSSGYSQMMEGDVSPWFRAHWALDGVAVDDETTTLLHHEPFVEGAKRLFGAEVVRPSTLLVNLMGPMPSGVPHVDTPTFRGLKRGDVPVWLLITMGASGLFERWSVRIAGALTWFYDGDDGELEYWPDGGDRPSQVVRGPFGNDALIADNDLMPHRVGAIGDAASLPSKAKVTASSTIEWAGDGWRIVTDGVPTGSLGVADVRVSLLWKALAFMDRADARRFDDHEDDLDVATIVSVFRADLAARGITVDEPDDPFTDAAWSRTLLSTYLRPIVDV